MKSEELDELLKDAKNQRFQTLQELQTELNQIPEKKLLGGIFSKFGR
jgi:hypothetical protein